MSDRFKGLVVTFDDTVHEELAEALQNAISLMHWVAVVSALVDGPDDQVNRLMIRREMETKILSALRDL